MLPADGPPLDPSPDEAHQWAVEELRKAVYRDEPSLVERVLTWLRDHLHVGGGSGGAFGAPSWVLYAVAVVVLAVVALVVLLTVRRDARRSPQRVRPVGVLGDDHRSAAQLRAAATAALASGRWDDAIMDGMRAVAAGVVERSVLEESPGRTASELAHDLGALFPRQAADLSVAAHHFDAVRYGHLPAVEGAARQVLATGDAVASARPVFADQVPAGVRGPR